MNEMTYNKFIQDILDTRGRFGCGDKYHECHHIQPKCLNGTDDVDNLIDLYAQEHFIAHRLLAKENPENEKLTYAWCCMAFAKNDYEDRYELTPEEYEEARIALSAAFKGKYIGENSPWFNRHHTEKTKRIISEKLKIWFQDKEHHPLYGKHLSDEHKSKISANHADVSGVNNPAAKPVLCIDTKTVYGATTIAGEQTNTNPMGICNCCYERAKSAGGYKWRLVYDTRKKDGTIIPGAITLGLITEEEALQQLNNNTN